MFRGVSFFDIICDQKTYLSLLWKFFLLYFLFSLKKEFYEESRACSTDVWELNVVNLCNTSSTLQLAFPDAIYLVDAIQGGEVLMKACKPALESVNITKVIHDCKRDSEVSN